jgi:hypothetical protein
MVRLQPNLRRVQRRKGSEVRDGEEKVEYYEVLLVTGKKKLGVAITADGKINKAEDKSREKDE